MEPYSQNFDDDSKSDTSETESIGPDNNKQDIQIKHKSLLDDDKNLLTNRDKMASEEGIKAASLINEMSASRTDDEEEAEAKDEFKKFIFFLHFPFVYLFSILAFLGACLDIGIAYPGQVLTQEIKTYLASSQHAILKNINDYILIMFMHFSTLGMELREHSLQTISFWVNFSSLANPQTNDPIALALDISTAFSPFSNWVLDRTNFN